MLHLWCQALVSEVNWFICPQLSNNHKITMLGEAGGWWVVAWERKGCWGSLGFERSDHGQMCGWLYCRRCGSSGQPLLNLQSSQHSDILENHICVRGDANENTPTRIYHTLHPVIPTPTPTQWKTLKTGREGNWIVHVLLFERCSALARPRPL